MALSIKQAEKFGLLTRSKANSLRSEMKAQSESVIQRIAKAAGNSNTSAAAINLQGANNFDSDPQRKIFLALERKHPGIAMWEVEGLVPGRKYRCDIYLPESRVVVEMDGYGPHRSKKQFQADRDKRNLLSATGYIVLAYYYSQVKNDLDSVITQILEAHSFYKPFMRGLFDAHLKHSQSGLVVEN